MLTCNLGTIGPGVQTLITFTATVSVTGTIVNTATVTGGGAPDTNPGNNVDSAQTLVVAPLRPPATPKPKPVAKPKPKPAVVKPAAEICSTLTVTQKLVRATGKPQVIRAFVKAGGKAVANARVQVLGPGLRLSLRTNRRGLAVAAVKPATAGIIRLSITNKKACNTQRIGVVAVFEPPVTG